jgi:hypothetical protein
MADDNDVYLFKGDRCHLALHPAPFEHYGVLQYALNEEGRPPVLKRVILKARGLAIPR